MKTTRRIASALAAGVLAVGVLAAAAASGTASASAGFVQGRSATPSGTAGTASLAFSSAVSSGDLLVAVQSSWQSAHTSVSAVTDSLGDTWAKAAAASSGGQETELWYTVSAKAGSDTVNVTWAAPAYRALSIAEYSGARTLDVSHGAGDISAAISHSSGATATSAAVGDLVVGGYGDPGSGGVITPGSGYAMAATDSPSSNMTVAAEHNLSLGSNSAVTAAFTSAASAQGATAVAAFTASGSQAQAPVVVTNAAASVGQTAATLSGSVNPEGQAATYKFDYGPTAGYGTSVPVPAGSAGSGTSAVSENFALSGLTPGTTYHYRIEAANATGTTLGNDQAFTTPGASGPAQLICPAVSNPVSGQVITCTYQ